MHAVVSILGQVVVRVGVTQAIGLRSRRRVAGHKICSR